MTLNDSWKPKLTLRELVTRQVYTGETDNELIAEWFEKNDMAIEGIEIISRLAKNKVESDQNKYGSIIARLQMYGATESLLKTFGKKDGITLDYICRKFIISDGLGEKFEEKYPDDIEWLRTIIPTKERPFVFWLDFLNYLHEQGIYFMDEKKGE